MDYDTVLILCEARIGNSEVKDLLMQFVLEAEEIILNYINQPEMPNGCKMIWVTIACEMYKYNSMDFTPILDGDEEFEAKLQNISDIKIDDAAVSDSITPALIAAKAIRAIREIDFIKNYRQRLHPFRKIRWGN